MEFHIFSYKSLSCTQLYKTVFLAPGMLLWRTQNLSWCQTGTGKKGRFLEFKRAWKIWEGESKIRQNFIMTHSKRHCQEGQSTHNRTKRGSGWAVLQKISGVIVVQRLWDATFKKWKNLILGYIIRSVVCKTREVIILLYLLLVRELGFCFGHSI